MKNKGHTLPGGLHRTPRRIRTPHRGNGPQPHDRPLQRQHHLRKRRGLPGKSDQRQLVILDRTRMEKPRPRFHRIPPDRRGRRTRSRESYGHHPGQGRSPDPGRHRNREVGRHGTGGKRRGTERSAAHPAQLSRHAAAKTPHSTSTGEGPDAKNHQGRNGRRCHPWDKTADRGNSHLAPRPRSGRPGPAGNLNRVRSQGAVDREGVPRRQQAAHEPLHPQVPGPHHPEGPGPGPERHKLEKTTTAAVKREMSDQNAGQENGQDRFRVVCDLNIQEYEEQLRLADKDPGQHQPIIEVISKYPPHHQISEDHIGLFAADA